MKLVEIKGNKSGRTLAAHAKKCHIDPQVKSFQVCNSKKHIFKKKTRLTRKQKSMNNAKPQHECTTNSNEDEKVLSFLFRHNSSLIYSWSSFRPKSLLQMLLPPAKCIPKNNRKCNLPTFNSKCRPNPTEMRRVMYALTFRVLASIFLNNSHSSQCLPFSTLQAFRTMTECTTCS